MGSELEQPGKYDAVLGGENPLVQPPVDGAVLGNFSRHSLFNLKILLDRQQWQAADAETQSIMLEICQRKSQGFLRIEDLDRIDRAYWHTIDNLWRTYSNERFGLSIQTEIWRSVGGTASPDWNAWCRFGRKIGWCIGDRWLYWNDIRFNIHAPRGHLPRNGAWMGWGLGDFWVGCKMLSAIDRKLASCQIIELLSIERSSS